MNTKLIITVSTELDRRARERAALEGVTLSEIIRQHLEEFAAGSEKPEEIAAKNGIHKNRKRKASRKPHSSSADEIKADLATLTNLNLLATEIGKHWPDGVSAVDAVREGRREL